MFCSLRVTFSILTVLLTPELFHYCSADEQVIPQPAAVPPPSFPGEGPPQFGQFGQFGIPPEVATRMMEQMQNMNLGQQIPRFTQPLIQAMRNVILSIEQLQSAMGVLENAPIPNA